jgi:predicted CDP-diglyceride synthetase/phosphatidate cytidylyltransferase
MTLEKLKLLFKSKRKKLSEATIEEIQTRIKRNRKRALIATIAVGSMCCLIVFFGLSIILSTSNVTAEMASRITQKITVQILFAEAGMLLTLLGFSIYSLFSTLSATDDDLMLKIELRIREAIKEELKHAN